MHIPLIEVEEAYRTLTICNACRYCEGLCATFQAMTDYRDFALADVQYLANLCHNCTACLRDCQYAQPHEFALDVPRALADARVESYVAFAWPASLGRLFERNGLVVSVSIALIFVAVVLAGSILLQAELLFARLTGPGSFYRIVDHGVMALVAGVTFGFALLCMVVSGIRFWRATGGGHLTVGALAGALGDVARMKYLDGGHGEGCDEDDEGYSQRRRIYHQLTMWGFVFCFAATCLGTIYHYALGRVAPYELFSLPVILGTVGGIGLLIGPVGLVREKYRSDPLIQPAHPGMDNALLVTLFLVSLSGLLLLALRDTAAMGMLLIAHLGLVLGFFVSMPYSKFVHGLYRFLALVRFHS